MGHMVNQFNLMNVELISCPYLINTSTCSSGSSPAVGEEVFSKQKVWMLRVLHMQRPPEQWRKKINYCFVSADQKGLWEKQLLCFFLYLWQDPFAVRLEWLEISGTLISFFLRSGEKIDTTTDCTGATRSLVHSLL